MTDQSKWPASNIERRPIDSLIEYARNSRTHTPEQVDKIAASIKEWGWTTPILVDEDDMIIAGHARTMAAKKLGLTSVPVIVARGWTDAQKKAYVLADNQLAISGAGWDEDLLKIELLDLADAQFDVSLLGFSDKELAAIMAPAPAEGLTDPDETPEAPQEPASELGDVWILGRHRLVCGDSTDPAAVEKALKGVVPMLMVTDPPYGVEYNAGWRAEAKNGDGTPLSTGKGRAKGKVENDDRGDWTAAWALFPGDVAYVWHGERQLVSIADQLQDSGFELRNLIVWGKSGLVVGRGNYHSQHETCQPAGTLVNKVVKRGCGSQPAQVVAVPIETLEDGDYVVSWNGSVVKARGAKIKVASRFYEGDLHEVSAAGRSTKTTHSHHWTIRISRVPVWLTYLMQRGSRWRVGYVRSFNTRGFGPAIRLRDQNGEAVWILGVHGTPNEARIHEQAISVKYGIPTTHWEVDNGASENCRTYSDIDEIYRLVGPLDEKATALLEAYGRDRDIPLARLDEIYGGKTFFSRKKTTVVRSCNLIPGLMEIPVPSGKARTSEPNGAGTEGYDWFPISAISRKRFSGLVYSLGVDEDEHYIADGLITHNCWYVVRKGGTGHWSGDRKQTTLWQIDKPQKSETGHSTQKPVECMARPIRNNSSPGQAVYEPFSGSGTTIIACEQEGRSCHAIELNAAYVDVAVTRWEKFAGKQAILEETGETYLQVLARRRPNAQIRAEKK